MMGLGCETCETWEAWEGCEYRIGWRSGIVRPPEVLFRRAFVAVTGSFGICCCSKEFCAGVFVGIGAGAVWLVGEGREGMVCVVEDSVGGSVCGL